MEVIDRVKMATYRHFAATGQRPDPGDIAQAVGIDAEAVITAESKLMPGVLRQMRSGRYSLV